MSAMTQLHLRWNQLSKRQKACLVGLLAATALLWLFGWRTIARFVTTAVAAVAALTTVLLCTFCWRTKDPQERRKLGIAAAVAGAVSTTSFLLTPAASGPAPVLVSDFELPSFAPNAQQSTNLNDDARASNPMASEAEIKKSAAKIRKDASARKQFLERVYTAYFRTTRFRPRTSGKLLSKTQVKKQIMQLLDQTMVKHFSDFNHEEAARFMVATSSLPASNTESDKVLDEQLRSYDVTEVLVTLIRAEHIALSSNSTIQTEGSVSLYAAKLKKDKTVRRLFLENVCIAYFQTTAYRPPSAYALLPRAKVQPQIVRALDKLIDEHFLDDDYEDAARFLIASFDLQQENAPEQLDQQLRKYAATQMLVRAIKAEHISLSLRRGMR